jgi:Glutamine amidotransferase class-I
MTADLLVFPGVGAFGAAMQVLNQNGCLTLSLFSLYAHFFTARSLFNWFELFRLGEALRMYIEEDKPFLGICLGLQLLFDSSEENGHGILFSPSILFHITSIQTIPVSALYFILYYYMRNFLFPGCTVNLTLYQQTCANLFLLYLSFLDHFVLFSWPFSILIA